MVCKMNMATGMPVAFFFHPWYHTDMDRWVTADVHVCASLYEQLQKKELDPTVRHSMGEFIK